MMISKRWGGAQSEVNTSNTKKLRIHVTFLLNITTLNIESGIIIKSQDESLNKSRIAKFHGQLYWSKGDNSLPNHFKVHFKVTCIVISSIADNPFTTVYCKSLSLRDFRHLTGWEILVLGDSL